MAETFPSFADVAPTRVGGALALDFVNTVEWRGDPQAKGERLVDYGEIAHWAAHAGIVERKSLRALLGEAARRPADAARLHQEALALREAIARLIARPARADLARLNAHLRDRPAALVSTGGAYVWSGGPTDLLAAPLAAVARDAAALLTSGRLARVRTCADPRCGWMFVDPGRGPGRRWCSMASCGNRAKARRHYRRGRSVTPARL